MPTSGSRRADADGVWRSVLGRASLALLAAVSVVVIAAPAVWVADAVARAGPFRLVHPAGSVWAGSALFGVSDGDQTMALPGRLSWTVDPGSLLTGRLDLSLSHPAMDNPVRLSLTRDDTRVEAGALRLPASFLTAFGPPFNTLRPAGEMRIAWSALQFHGESADAHAEMTWTDASSALSSVVPLGRFRLDVDLRGRTGEARLRTLEGPLRLEGRGTLDERAIRFAGEAGAEPDRREVLGALLGVLGKRSGDKVLLQWELRR